MISFFTKIFSGITTIVVSIAVSLGLMHTPTQPQTKIATEPPPIVQEQVINDHQEESPVTKTAPRQSMPSQAPSAINAKTPAPKPAPVITPTPIPAPVTSPLPTQAPIAPTPVPIYAPTYAPTPTPTQAPSPTPTPTPQGLFMLNIPFYQEVRNYFKGTSAVPTQPMYYS